MSNTNTETQPNKVKNVETVQDSPLTIREHLDPDKHWIGEALAPPSQTEIEATIGTVATPGESPFVARADHKHKVGAGVYTNVHLAGTGVTLTDDQAAYIVLGVVMTYGIVAIASNTGVFSAIVAFRIGDTGAQAYLLGSTTPASTTAGIGSLAGTSGVDGQFTIRSWNSATAARLYIENRTGATRAWSATFLSLSNPNAVITGWVIV